MPSTALSPHANKTLFYCHRLAEKRRLCSEEKLTLARGDKLVCSLTVNKYLGYL